MAAAPTPVLDWQNIVMAYCFTSALDIAIVFVETKSSQPSPSYYVLSFAILLTFLSLFVAKLIAQNFIFVSKVLEKVAVVVAATAFVLNTTFPFSVKLKCSSWVLYAVSLLTIIVCNFISEDVKLESVSRQPLTSFSINLDKFKVSIRDGDDHLVF